MSKRVPIVLKDRLQVGRIGLADPNPLSPITLENNSGAKIVIGVSDSSVVLQNLENAAYLAVTEMFRGATGEPGPPGEAGAPGSGSTIHLSAAYAIEAFSAVGFGAPPGGGSSDHAILNDPLSPNLYSFAGISLNSACGINDSIEVATSGPVTNPAWNFEPRRVVFAGPDGTLTQEVPTAPGTLIHAIGIAMTPTTMNLRPLISVRL